MHSQTVLPAKGLGLLVHDVARLLRRQIDQRAQTIGLTSAQWRVLAAVARTELLNQEPLNQAGLADQMDMEPITLSRQVDRMEAAGMIERRPDPTDRRAYRLYLTEAARPLVTDFRAVATECVTAALAGVSDAEIDAVVDVLSRIRANLVRRPDTSEAVAAEAALPPIVPAKESKVS
jgi:DNA-binding MarR family transcriptional regulator